MPHHSGGGSHSGGSHHSSHSSSHGGGNKGPRISRKPFYNSRRFRYYGRNGTEHYVYSTVMPRRMSIFELIFNFIFLLPFLAVGIFSFSLVMPVKPLTPVYEAPDVHIEDHIGAIDNNSSLEKSLNNFEELTGISPYIITVYDSEWQDNFYDLIDYSYDLYVNHFNDEQHFLIVYSEPENADELSFVDWKWEAMQGDDTDPIITEENFARFQDDLQEGLTRNSTSTGEAMEDAFINSLDYMMKIDKNALVGNLFFPVFWNSIVLIFIISFIKDFIISRREYVEVPMENASGYNGGGSNGTNTSFYNPGSDYGTNAASYNTGGNYGTSMPGNNIGNNYGTSMAGNNMGSNYGTDMPGNNIGNNYGTSMAGNNMGSNYGTDMSGNNTGNNYGTSMSDYNLNHGSSSDYNYQNDDQKYSQDNAKTGGGYILNGEYYDASGKKS